MKNCIILHEKYTLTINGIHRFSFEMLNVSVYMVYGLGKWSNCSLGSQCFFCSSISDFLNYLQREIKVKARTYNFYAVCIVICKDILTHCMVHKLGLGLNSCIRNCFWPSFFSKWISQWCKPALPTLKWLIMCKLCIQFAHVAQFQ